MGSSKSLLESAGILLNFVKFKPSLKRLVARIVEPQDIEDILQETYIRVSAASEKTEIVNPRSFMLKTAQNLAYNSLSTAYHRRVQIEDFSTSDIELLTEDLASQWESSERFQGFCRAVRTLPLQCRRAFILSKIYGLSQQEIADYLEISESTVEKHIAKGFLLCRESMLRMGHIDAGFRKKRSTHGK